jgi:hypothetical protein
MVSSVRSGLRELPAGRYVVEAVEEEAGAGPVLLLISQRLDWTDARSAPGREHGGKECRCKQRGHRDGVGSNVPGVEAEQELTGQV